jgi:hypothetical protein
MRHFARAWEPSPEAANVLPALYGEENRGAIGTEHKETKMKKLILIVGLIVPGMALAQNH